MTNAIVRNAFVYTSYDGESESTGWVVTDADIELCRHWCDAFEYDMVVFFTGGEWTYTDSEPERKTRGQLHRDIQALYADMRKCRATRERDESFGAFIREMEQQIIWGASVPADKLTFTGLASGISSITQEQVKIDYSLVGKYGPVSDIGPNGGISTAIATARAMEMLHSMARCNQEPDPYISSQVPDAYYQGREIPIQGDTTDFVSINVRLMTEEEYDAIRAHHVVFPGQHDPWGTSWGVAAIDDAIRNHPHTTDEKGNMTFLGWNGEQVKYCPDGGSDADE